MAAWASALAALPGCDDELIRLGAGANGPDAAAVEGGADATTDTPADDAAASCPHATVAAAEVLWIGDSWINVPGGQLTGVRDLARAAGAIGPGDDYLVGAAPGATINTIANQYATQEATATKVKVLIMDGGTIDTIAATGSDASVTAVVASFNQLLAKIAADGTVQQIVYFLVPELPAIYGVAALRPLLQQACAGSAVPCHFVDLQTSWAGHPEYTAANGILPTDAGARVMANQIWSTMQTYCIAQ